LIKSRLHLENPNPPLSNTMTEFETKLIAVLEKIAVNTFKINDALYDMSKDFVSLDQAIFEKNNEKL